MKLKKLFIAFGFLVSLGAINHLYAQPTPAPLPDDSLSFCRKQAFAKSCLSVLLTYRCTQYYFPFNPLKEKLCSASAVSMLNYLDYKTVEVVENNQIYRFKIIFTNKLKELVNTPAVQVYLSSLERDLSEAMQFHKPFDLYKYTLKHAKTRDNAILWLGILFQDTTFSRVQVQYLEDLDLEGKLSYRESKVKMLMKKIAIMLDPKNLVKEDFRSWLKLYPDLKNNDLNLYLNPTFYHFYPIALMATHLRKNVLLKNYAHLVPFMLNSEYEFQSLDSDHWPWRHPKSFVLTPKLKWKMIDIYTGLAASLFGAKKEKLMPKYYFFGRRFAQSPFETMKSWAFNSK